jgi:hypothetical protein
MEVVHTYTTYVLLRECKTVAARWYLGRRISGKECHDKLNKTKVGNERPNEKENKE